MKLIPLKGGRLAKVDDDDYPIVCQYKWWIQDHKTRFYARTNGPTIRGRRRGLLMHRLIFGLRFKDGKQIDHVNSDGLDNRRCNLRLCTNQENQFNRRRHGKFSSRFKGVYWDKRVGRWHAQIKLDNRRVNLGYFANESDAARAYNRAARKHFGEFANFNN
jgi:hypothetical protein